MAAFRTRKLLVLTRIAAVCGLGWLALVPVTVRAAPAGPGEMAAEVAIGLTEPAPGSQRMVVEGSWPTPCLPTSAQLSRSGNDLRVETRSNRGLCTRYGMPFRFELDPQAATGKPLERGVYRVSFYAANASSGPLELRGFSLLNVGEAPLQPEMGFWWPEHSLELPQDNARGTALTLDRQGDMLAASLLTYDNEGRPAWYFGSGRFDGRVAFLPLVGMRDGPGLFGGGRRRPNTTEELMLQLEFSSGNRATAWLGWYEQTPDQPRLHLQQLVFARESLIGPTLPEHWAGAWLMLRGDHATRVELQQPQRLDAEHFELGDADGWKFVCHHAATRAQSPPDSCVLSHGSGEDIRLDSVGLEQLDGSDHRGAAVRLVRPPVVKTQSDASANFSPPHSN